MTSHFHVKWQGGRLDWERHVTREAAEATAKYLAQPDEDYSVVDFGDGECPYCDGSASAPERGETAAGVT